MKLEDFYSVDAAKAALAGAAGGVVRWITLRQSAREGFGAILVGSLGALYAGPIVQPILEPVIGQIAPGGDSAGFAAFIVGIGGIGIFGWLIDVVSVKPKSKENANAKEDESGDNS